MKYCGGCRANYDRRAEAERTIALARAACLTADISFVPAERDGVYDALLVVCGCATRCVDISSYHANGRVFFIDAEGGGAAIAEKLVRMRELVRMRQGE